MTVSSATARASYSGDGTTTSFAVPFYFIEDDDVLVTLRDTAGSETTWVLSTQYTLTGAGNAAGGTLTVSTSPTDYTPAVGETLVITRNVDLKQETDYVENDDFPAETHEAALDKLTMIAQQQQDLIDKKIGFSLTSSATATLPDPVANNLLSWNSAGTDLVNVAAVDVSLVTATAYAQTLLDDADAAEARTTLGLGTAAVEAASAFETADPDILKADTTDNLEAGYTASIDTNIGTVTSGTVTPDETASNWFKYTNNGAHVLAPPSITAGTAVVIYVDITNAASAGAITTSSFDVIEGDSFDTVNGNKFQCTVSVSDIGSRLFIRAMQ